MSLRKNVGLFILSIILLLYTINRFVGFCMFVSKNNCRYHTFNIKDYNLSEYFNKPVLGIRKSATSRGWDNEFPYTIKFYEWKITFKDYYQNNQTYTIRTLHDFNTEIANISADLLIKEVKTIISQKFPNISNHLEVELENLNTIDGYVERDLTKINNFTPKDVNFYTFFKNNPKSSLSIYIGSPVTDNDINNIANYLFEKSSNPINLQISKSLNIYCGLDDIRYIKNNLVTTKACQDYYSIIKSNN